MPNSYAIRSVTSPENFTKLTVSCWFKGQADGTQRGIWGIYDSASTTKFFGIYYSSNGSLYAYWRQGGSGIIFTLGTMQKFNDPNAWYHLVLTMDTTLATASDRVKMYINGERITVFEDSLDTITQDFDCANLGDTNGRIQWGGNVISGTQYYWNGLLSHCHMCVGYAYQASSFGETDATTGEWKINTSPSVSYGTNGGWYFKDSAALTDHSSNSNTLTVGGGTLTKTEDCPSNVFATMNPLDYNSTTIEEGNNRIAWSQSAGNFAITTGTIGMTTGKYYWEAQVTSDDNSTGIHLGVLQTEPYISRTTSPTVNTSLFYGLGIRLATNKSVYRTSNGTDSSISDTWSNNSVIRIAYDGDAGKIYMWKDATEFNGQTFSSNTSFNSATLTAGTMVLPFIGFGDGGSGTKNAHANFNFGNGYFGSTAVSSAGTNASGNGIFEYDVPTGFTALSTKGLNL